MIGLLSISNSNLGSLGADYTKDIASIKEQVAVVEKQILELNERESYLNSRYAIDHYGGQSPAEFNRIMARDVFQPREGLTAQINALNLQLEEIYKKQEADKQSASVLKGGAATDTQTAAQKAEEFQRSTEEARKFYTAIAQAGYDYGRGTTRRNLFFGGDRGLAGLGGWYEDLTPTNRVVMAGALLALAILIFGRKGR